MIVKVVLRKTDLLNAASFAYLPVVGGGGLTICEMRAYNLNVNY